MGTCPALVLWNRIPGRCLTDLPSSAVRYSSQELQDKHTRVRCLQTREAGLPVTSRRSTTNYVSADKAAINNTNSEGGVKQEVAKTVEM